MTLRHFAIIIISWMISLSSITARAKSGRITVVPVFFVPADVSWPTQESDAAMRRLMASLKVAQAFYLDLLKTDTFALNDSVLVYRSKQPLDHFNIDKSARPDSAHRMVKELFDWRNEDRLTSHSIYVTVLVRGGTTPCKGCVLGGGRTFNGMPGTGGGIVQIEFDSIVLNKYYTLDLTLVHEIGHALGLGHVSCLGHDQQLSDSIMSYNRKNGSRLLSGVWPGALLPEEYYLLGLNKSALPTFLYDSRLHNPNNVALNIAPNCYLPPMGLDIGDLEHSGYILFLNNKRVSSRESSLIPLSNAMLNCAWNIDNHKDLSVKCLYFGVDITNQSSLLTINRTRRDD